MDALGVCGGTCASDVNNNGVCDLDELAQSGASACGDGTVWDEDSQTCVAFNDCPSDLDGNGDVGVSDLLILLSDFGLVCPPEVVEWACGDPLGYQGYDYATVLIGEQCWFAENLRSAKYLNGDSIPSNLSDSLFMNTTEGCVSVYGAGDSYCQAYVANNACDPSWSLEQFGRLYNKPTVMDERGICPSGWHLPTVPDWEVMFDFLGGQDVAGIKIKSSSGWAMSGGESGNGNNSSGFSGLPSGYRGGGGSYLVEGWVGNWWAHFPASYGRYYGCNAQYDQVTTFSLGYPYYAVSVRCIQDSE